MKEMEALAVIISCIVFFVDYIEAVPPEACFANFRWDDCGHPPVPVMYYWKPGSRCEVGIWRGCQPSLNMFKNEYECVSTCIFTITARPANWHEVNRAEEVDYAGMESTTIDGETTIIGSGEESGSGDGGSGEQSGDAGSGDTADGSGSGDASGDGDGADDVAATDAEAPEEAGETTAPD